jgi:hypothetical protein
VSFIEFIPEAALDTGESISSVLLNTSKLSVWIVLGTPILDIIVTVEDLLKSLDVAALFKSTIEALLLLRTVPNWQDPGIFCALVLEPLGYCSGIADISLEAVESSPACTNWSPGHGAWHYYCAGLNAMDSLGDLSNY